MPHLFSAYKVVQNHQPNISAYLIESTTPDNIDDQFVTHELYDQLECLNPDTAIDQIADTLANGTDPTLVISVHGFNNPRDVILQTYKNSFDCVINDDTINKRDVVCIGYRWPSEKIGAPFFTAFRAAPLFLIGLLVVGVALSAAAFLAPILPQILRITIGGLGAFALTISFTLFLLRIVVYFRDTYRATSYGVPDLVEIIRQIDKKSANRRRQIKEAANTNLDKNWVNLSFMGHSMGAYVVTGAVRILSDVFQSESISDSVNDSLPVQTKEYSSNKLSNIGDAFLLMRLVLVSPDIPAETLISNRANFLAASLRRFDEAFLFSNEGDEVLRQISSMANYFSFPTRSRKFGYRLGNVGVLRDYGINEDMELKDLRVGYMTLQKLYDKLNLRVDNNADLPPHALSYFDCTDAIDSAGPNQEMKGVLTFAKPDLPNDMCPSDHLRLLCRYIRKGNPDVHGGYFKSGVLSKLIYRLVCIGYDETETAYNTGQQDLNGLCQLHQIRALLKG